MQVLTRVHDDKYQAFGGNRAAFDPISNLRVGVQVLKECIARAGNVQEGLKHYVGAALVEGDGGYVNRVMSEQSQMRSVADGKSVPVVPGSASPALKAVGAVGGSASAAGAASPAAAADQVALLR
jgi:hypothetical protein